jgi:hypothetical protein
VARKSQESRQILTIVPVLLPGMASEAGLFAGALGGWQIDFLDYQSINGCGATTC